MATKDEIIARALSTISSDYDTSEGSFMYDAIVAVATVLEDAYIEMGTVEDKAFVENLFYDELDKKVLERGLTRKAAISATTTISIAGTNGTVIPIGSRFFIDDIYFDSTEEKTIVNGTASVFVLCEQSGSIGNVPANSIVNFDPIIGINTVTNPNPVTNGTEQESDDDLKSRYYEEVHNPAASGNIQDYINWCMEVAGVGDAKVIPTWDGNGTVKCVIINSNKRATDQSLVDAVSANIEVKRPILADVTVESATELTIDISVDVDLSDGYDLATVNASISDSFTSYLDGIAFQKDYVSYAVIGSVILDVDGVSDYRDLSLNGGTSNITIGNTQVAVVGTVNVS